MHKNQLLNDTKVGKQKLLTNRIFYCTLCTVLLTITKTKEEGNMENNHRGIRKTTKQLGLLSFIYLQKAIKIWRWMYQHLLLLSLPFICSVYVGAGAAYFLDESFFLTTGLLAGTMLAVPLVCTQALALLLILVSFWLYLGFGCGCALIAHPPSIKKICPKTWPVISLLILCVTPFLAIAWFIGVAVLFADDIEKAFHYGEKGGFL